MPVKTAKKIPATSIEELMKLDEPNSEGFVIFYPKENVRMKIKFPEYVRLHKIVTGVSEIGVWEMLRDGADFAPLLEKVPDEFFKWLEGVKVKLKEAYHAIEAKAAAQYAAAMFEAYPQEGVDVPRKDIALAIQKHMDQPGIGFALLDKKPFDHIIWKMVRPHGKRIFKTDIDL
jgi:RNA ligase